MRVAYLVTRSDTIGGSHVHVRDLALALKRQGDEAALFMGGSGPLIEQFRNLGLQVRVIPALQRAISPVKDLKAYGQLKEALLEFKPDLVSTHSSKAGFLGRLAARKLGIPVLFTAHGWPFSEGRRQMERNLYRTLEKWISQYTDRIITVSEYDKHLAKRAFALDDGRILTIHNGMVDIQQSLRANTKGSGSVNIVMVARLDRQKNHVGLLNATKEIEQVHLHFVGDGPLMDEVSGYVDELGMAANVTFWGRINHVEEVLAESQIFVLFSNWEGFPRSTLEAMRAGLPVIVSNTGGAAEAVLDGVTGYVVPQGDVSELKNRITKLVENPELRSQMGNAGRKRYEEEFTFTQMFDRTYRVYKELIEPT